MTAGALVWVQAARPRTLVAGAIPVMVGSALAWKQGAFRPMVALAALAGALLIQIGTNLANDYYDFRRGADTADRLGPRRVSQAGLVSPPLVLSGALVSFAAAMVVGLYLVSVGGLPILIVGLASVLAGYCYTGGPWPLGYHGLGDLFVLVFFGLVAVCGTVFVQAGTLSLSAVVASLPVGALGVALLAVNNVRDEATDRRANKRTLVVRLGAAFGRAEYVTMVGLAFVTPVAMWLTGLAGVKVVIALGALPLALAATRALWRESGSGLNRVLAATARLQLVFGVLFALGLAS